jgi:hypothetical protein
MRRIVFFIAGVGKPSFFPSGYFFREEAAPTFLTPYNCKKRGNENAQTGKILYLIEHLFTEEHPPECWFREPYRGPSAWSAERFFTRGS